jgi:hypothetical protein
MKNLKIKAVNAPQFVKHLQTLSTLAGLDYPYPFDLYSELVKLERRANRICTLDCNGEIDSEKAATQLIKIKDKVLKLLPLLSELDLFVNGDPRGYSLKIREEKAKELNIYTDWGSYGILAPEFN